eukprot:1793806-Pyramimonas_sp.AAC.1
MEAHRGFRKAPLWPLLTMSTPRKLSSSNSNALANSFHAYVKRAQALKTGRCIAASAASSARLLANVQSWGEGVGPNGSSAGNFWWVW